MAGGWPPPGPQPAAGGPPPYGAWPPYGAYPYMPYPPPVVYRFGTTPPNFPATSRFKLAPCPPALTLQPNTYVVTESAGSGLLPALLGGMAAIVFFLAAANSRYGLSTWADILGHVGSWVCAFLVAATAAAFLRDSGVLSAVMMAVVAVVAVIVPVVGGASDTQLAYVIIGAAVAGGAAAAHFLQRRPRPAIDRGDDDADRPWPRWDPERAGAYGAVIGGLLLCTGAIVTGVVETGTLPAFGAMIVVGIVVIVLAGMIALAPPGDLSWLSRRPWSMVLAGLGFLAAFSCGAGAPSIPYNNSYYGFNGPTFSTTMSTDYLFHTIGGVMMVIGIGWIIAGAAYQFFKPTAYLLVAKVGQSTAS